MWVRLPPRAPVSAAGSFRRAAMLSRRKWLHHAIRIAAGVPLGSFSLACARGISAYKDSTTSPSPRPPQIPTSPLFSSDPTKYHFTNEEDAFLEEIERASFQF